MGANQTFPLFRGMVTNPFGQPFPVSVGLSWLGKPYSRFAKIYEPPHLNWSTVIFRKRRTKTDKQTTKARRDCLEVTAS